MLSLLVGYVYPLKRRIWVMDYKGRIYLRKLHRTVYKEEHDTYYRYWVRGKFPFIFDMDRVELWNTHLICGSHYIQAWGEYKPWWGKHKEQQTLIEINIEARERSERLSKTRTLPEVWKQG